MLSSEIPPSPASIILKDEPRQCATSEVNFDLRKLRQISDVLISEQEEEAIGRVNNFESQKDKYASGQDYG